MHLTEQTLNYLRVLKLFTVHSSISQIWGGGGLCSTIVKSATLILPLHLPNLFNASVHAQHLCE